MESLKSVVSWALVVICVVGVVIYKRQPPDCDSDRVRELLSRGFKENLTKEFGAAEASKITFNFRNVSRQSLDRLKGSCVCDGTITFLYQGKTEAVDISYKISTSFPLGRFEIESMARDAGTL